MSVQGPHEYFKNWIGLDADTRPTVHKGTKYFVSDTGYWEIYTGAGWKTLPAKHKPPTPSSANDFSSDGNCVAVYKLDSDDGGAVGSVLYLDSKNSFDLSHIYSGYSSDDANFAEGDGSLFCGAGALGILPGDQDATWPGSLFGGHNNALVSWCYWVRFDNVEYNEFQHYHGIVSKFTAGKGMWRSSSGHGSNKQPQLVMGYGTGSTYETVTYSDRVWEDIWYHFQCAINGITGDYFFRIWDDNAKAYLDGDGAGNALTGTYVNTPGIILDTEDTDLRICTGSGTYRHEGNIDEVVLWNVIKSQTDFDEVKSGTYGGPAPDYRFSPLPMTTASLPSPFVVTESTYYSTLAGYLSFSGRLDAGYFWVTAEGNTTGWVKLDIGSGNSEICTKYRLTAPEPGAEALRQPKTWTLQGSNNDSDWDTLDTVVSEETWGVNETREFFCDTATTAYRYFKLDVTVNNGHASYLSFGELVLFVSAETGEHEFSPNAMESDTVQVQYDIAWDSAYTTLRAYRCFDGAQGASQYWVSNSGSPACWVSISDGDSHRLSRYVITANWSIGEITRAPKDWTVEGSDTGAWAGEEVTLDTVTGETAWSVDEARSFTPDVITTAYKYFRVNITDNNGDASYTSIGELDLFETFA